MRLFLPQAISSAKPQGKALTPLSLSDKLLVGFAFEKIFQFLQILHP